MIWGLRHVILGDVADVLEVHADVDFDSPKTELTSIIKHRESLYCGNPTMSHFSCPLKHVTPNL
jgi:hypothetical protein